jgi:SOS-response transcriptional repressor LexA
MFPVMGRPLEFETEVSLRSGASAEQRLLEFTRRHYRRYGSSPSYGEIEQGTGIGRSHIGAHLRRLELKGMVRLLGVARGILLNNRGDMLSDIELELVAAARGAAITWPKAQVAGLVQAYPIPRGTDSELPLADLLAQIDDAATGASDDADEGQD